MSSNPATAPSISAYARDAAGLYYKIGGSGASGGTGGADTNMRYMIATPDAPSTVRAEADLDLAGVSNVATSLQTALNANSRVLIVGPNITLPASSSVVVSNSVDILSYGTTITLPASMPAPASSRPAGFKIQGTRTQMTGWALPSTLTYGDDRLAFTTLPSGGVAVGDWINIRTTNQNNSNRPAEYVKGEIQQVAAVSGNTVFLSGTLRDSYLNDGTMQLYKLDMLQNVVVDGLHVRANPSAVNAAEIWAIQMCEAPIIRNCKVSGVAGYYGLGVFYSVQVLIDRLWVSNIYDKFFPFDGSGNATSLTGYGVHIGGSERVLIRNIRADRCKHAIDAGQFSTSHPVPRHIVVDGGNFEHTYASAFGVHNVEDIQIRNVTVRGCNGGIHVRGSDVLIDGFRMYGATKSTPPDTNPSSNWPTQWGAGIFIGEEASSEGAVRGGPAGTNLVIKNTIIDTPWVGSSTNYIQGFNGIEIVDPLVDAYIEAVISTTGIAFLSDGDRTERSTINLKVDRSYATNAYGQVQLYPAAVGAGTYLQQVAHNRITVVSNSRTSGGPGTPGAALIIGGGVRGGTSQHNIIDLSVPQLATGQTANTPQLVFASGGSFGPNYVNTMVAPFTNQTPGITEGSANVVLGPYQQFAFTTSAYPDIVSTTTAVGVAADNRTLTVSCPTGYIDGDYLVAVLVSQGSDIATNPTQANGFAPIGPTPTTSSTTMRYNAVYGKAVSGGQPTTFSFVFPAGSAAANRNAVAMFLIRGQSGTVGQSGNAAVAYSGASPSTLTWGTIGVSQPNSLVLACAHTNGGSGVDGTVATPSGWTVASAVTATGSTGSSDWLHIFKKASSAAVTGLTATVGSASTSANATFGIALYG